MSSKALLLSSFLCDIEAFFSRSACDGKMAFLIMFLKDGHRVQRTDFPFDFLMFVFLPKLIEAHAKASKEELKISIKRFWSRDQTAYRAASSMLKMRRKNALRSIALLSTT